jgi:hypothetical protein
MILHLKKKNGKTNVAEVIEKLISLAHAMKDNEEFVIETTKNHLIASPSQYRYLFGYVYKTIAIHVGHDVDEIHEMCKLKFNTEEIIFPNGVVEITIGSLKGKDTKKLFDYTTKVKNWASKHLDVKWTEREDMDYLRWMSVTERYDNTFNRIEP